MPPQDEIVTYASPQLWVAVGLVATTTVVSAFWAGSSCLKWRRGGSPIMSTTITRRLFISWSIVALSQFTGLLGSVLFPLCAPARAFPDRTQLITCPESFLLETSALLETIASGIFVSATVTRFMDVFRVHSIRAQAAFRACLVVLAIVCALRVVSKLVQIIASRGAAASSINPKVALFVNDIFYYIAYSTFGIIDLAAVSYALVVVFRVYFELASALQGTRSTNSAATAMLSGITTPASNSTRKSHKAGLRNTQILILYLATCLVILVFFTLTNFVSVLKEGNLPFPLRYAYPSSILVAYGTCMMRVLVLIRRVINHQRDVLTPVAGNSLINSATIKASGVTEASLQSAKSPRESNKNLASPRNRTASPMTRIRSAMATLFIAKKNPT